MDSSRPTRPRSSLYGQPEIQALSSKPTLPSLRSQVGEYLPQTSRRASISGLNNAYHHQEATPPMEPASGGRSTTSSLLGSSVIYRGETSRVGPSALSTSSNLLRTQSRNSNIPPPESSKSIRSEQKSYGSVAPPSQSSATRSTVSVACTNCRSAHLACSDARPCRRCVQTGRSSTCIDVEPRKRGRPRASDLTPVSTTTSMMQNLSTGNQITNRSGSLAVEDLVIIMSTSLRCARLTATVPMFLGYSPKDMLEQPLSTFIHPDEKQDYARFSLGLLYFPGVTSRPVPVSASRLHQASISELKSPLSGAPIHTRTFRLRTASNTWTALKFEAYLGSAFGAHPSDPESLRYTYVVVKLYPMTNVAGQGLQPSSSSSNSFLSLSMTSQVRNPSERISSSVGYECQLGSSSSTRAPPPRAPSEDINQSRHRALYSSSYGNLRPSSRSGLP
ncbi:hypothetical protein BY996DRAFT_6430794 [Phakopsora pachyrhizi]|uniref:Transcription activator of gluconeogenesis ERT1 n=1 Tax=Phakopsora pachyrhizi TaxID=170000 RepID=A0AAV0BDL4_PHAPC|nr:hypothetical protein BY996DRAFT_6430794 [Phakopsora pachyrhizi]CAH7684540.1 expressed protein [Phakopsora pachyrhizi]